jgi:hypothetical protein
VEKAARSGHCDDITTNRLFYFIMLKMLKIDFSSPFFPSPHSLGGF